MWLTIYPILLSPCRHYQTVFVEPENLAIISSRCSSPFDTNGPPNSFRVASGRNHLGQHVLHVNFASGMSQERLSRQSEYSLHTRISPSGPPGPIPPKPSAAASCSLDSFSARARLLGVFASTTINTSFFPHLLHLSIFPSSHSLFPSHVYQPRRRPPPPDLFLQTHAKAPKRKARSNRSNASVATRESESRMTVSEAESLGDRFPDAIAAGQDGAETGSVDQPIHKEGDAHSELVVSPQEPVVVPEAAAGQSLTQNYLQCLVSSFYYNKEHSISTYHSIITNANTVD
ncbi:hypothetical protein NM208_g8426 [Fusarium decemcellulare]|uniref:Uncharacterized protein n=1 Tax=Fusarium decemcellulare TaxID=57161 RepID=A0ACC1S5C1_9HYPO|nr:hypothetical protein NM208_g8426 [Fusarium decemcellulare]